MYAPTYNTKSTQRTATRYQLTYITTYTCMAQSETILMIISGSKAIAAVIIYELGPFSRKRSNVNAWIFTI